MAQKQIKKNQVVWAKLKGFPWWPSSVQSVDKTNAIVNFLGEYSHATINTEFVHDFKDNYNQYIKKVNNKNKKLKLAVEIALRISNGTSTYEQERNEVERKLQMDGEDNDDSQINEDNNNNNEDEDGGDKQIQIQSFNNTHTDPSSSQDLSQSKKLIKSNAKQASIKKSTAKEPLSKKQSQTQLKRHKNKQEVEQDQLEHMSSGQQTGENELAVGSVSSSVAQLTSKKAKKISDKQRKKVGSNEERKRKDIKGDDEQDEQDIPILDPSFLPGNDSSSDGQSPENKDLREQQQQQVIFQAKHYTATTKTPHLPQPSAASKSSKRPKHPTKSALTSTNFTTSTNPTTSHQEPLPKKKSRVGAKQHIIPQSSSAQSSSKFDNLIFYNNPCNATELQSSVEVVIQSLVDTAALLHFKIDGPKELERMCDCFLAMNLTSFEILKSNVGRIFMKALLQDQRSFRDVLVSKLEAVVKKVKEKILEDTFGQEYQDIAYDGIANKYNNVDNNCSSLGYTNETMNNNSNNNDNNLINNAPTATSHLESSEIPLEIDQHDQSNASHNSDNKHIITDTNNNIISNQDPSVLLHLLHPEQQQQQLPQSISEKDLEQRLCDQQLRKKICKKINELLKTTYGLEKPLAQGLSVRIERKIKSQRPDIGAGYKNAVKGMINLLKAKEVSVEQLESESLELMAIIEQKIISQDLRQNGLLHLEQTCSTNSNFNTTD